MVSVNTFSANLLIVGDETEKTHPFNQWLEPYRISFVQDSEQAIKAIRQSAPDLVLLDPNLNGSSLQVCSAVKNDEGLGFVPIIMLLPTKSGAAESAFESGADEVLVEPIQKGE